MFLFNVALIGATLFLVSLLMLQYFNVSLFSEAATKGVLKKKLFLETQNSQGNTCARVFFNKVAGLTLAQVFSCEFCEISKSTFFTEHLWTTAFVFYVALFDIALFIVALFIVHNLMLHYINVALFHVLLF